MISMAIFTILVTIGIGTILTAITQHRTTQDSRTVMDNLNFIMEDMSRNIRLGSNVRCVTDPSEVEPIISGGAGPAAPIAPQSCLSGVPSSATSSKIILNDLNGNHLTYAISVPPPGSTDSDVYKQSGDVSGTAEIINPPEIRFDFTKSGFTVRGAEAGDSAQPTVTIRLAGKIVYKDTTTNFAIQSTVTLRGLDS